MNVIYFLCGSNAVRVPFFVYNKDLFGRFVRGGDFWDKEQQEFVFRRDINAESLSAVYGCRSTNFLVKLYFT